MSIYLCIGNCLCYSTFNICTWVNAYVCIGMSPCKMLLLAQAQSIKIILWRLVVILKLLCHFTSKIEKLIHMAFASKFLYFIIWVKVTQFNSHRLKRMDTGYGETLVTHNIMVCRLYKPQIPANVFLKIVQAWSGK